MSTAAPSVIACLGKPDRNVAEPMQRLVVSRPVGDFVSGLSELVAAAVGEFVRHREFLLLDKSDIMPVRLNGRGFSIYAKTPSAVLPLRAVLRVAMNDLAPLCCSGKNWSARGPGVIYSELFRAAFGGGSDRRNSG